MQIIRKYRLPKSKIETLKGLIKQELSFKVRVRVNRQKYAQGSFNILPPKQTDFNDEQLAEINIFLERHNLIGNDGYWQGVSYIYGS